MRFNRVLFKEKRAFEKGWQKKPYSYDEIKKYIPKENYGVLCGKELRVLDDDSKDKKLILMFIKNFGPTFRVRDHLYFTFDNKHDKKIILMDKKEHLGEIQGEGTYVVGCGSTHPSGEIYDLIHDLPILEISYEKFIEVFDKYINSNNKKLTKYKTNISKCDTFTESIKKQWVDGNRQDLALSLAGYLRKNKRLGINSALAIVENIARECNDEEISQRLAAVRATYEKDEIQIRGVAGLKDKGIQERVVVMSKFSPVPFSERIEEENIFIYDKHKRFWRYDDVDGIWKDNAEQFVRTILRNNLFGEEQQKRNYVEEVLAYIKEKNYKEDFIPNSDPYLIAFQNKVFDLNSGEFKDFRPEYYLTNKLKIKIDENIKDCPNIDRFFSESIGGEYKEILYDLAAYCLFKQFPYQKVFFIHGPASTGKSQYMNLLEVFLGENNYCSFEPNDIQKDPYAAGQMLYKLANIASDINYNALDNVNQIKKLSGGDTIKVRLMYKEPFNEKIYCKQIFSTNKMPEVKEKTNAWYRRIYPIEFANIVPQEKRNPFIIYSLTEEKELQGLAYKCMKRLIKLKENKFVFKWDINEEEISNVYEELSNPIKKFVKDNTDGKKCDSSYWVYQFEFKERLNNWLTANHYPVMTSTQINEYMKENYNSSNRNNLRGDGKYRVWVGLKWSKSSHNVRDVNHFNHFYQSGKKLIYIEKKFQKG